MLYFLLIALFTSPEGIQVKVNQEEPRQTSMVLATAQDDLSLYYHKKTHWIVYEPVHKEYNNLATGANELAYIKYKTRVLTPTASSHIDLDLPPGTYYIGNNFMHLNSSFSTYTPLHLTLENVVQVTIREDDSYVGLLTELIGLPFVIPPKLLGKYGHQTDLRIGTDCAELAIYGMRRMGYKTPYCGPQGITDYLKPTSVLKSGTIIHFGHQVSVLYEDRGKIGTLDGEDLLIHAYLDKVSIEPLGELALADKAYQLYEWPELQRH